MCLATAASTSALIIASMLRFAGIGALGSEVVLIPDIHFHIDITGNRVIPLIYPMKTDIDQGSRISARTQATNNTDIIEAVLICTGF